MNLQEKKLDIIQEPQIELIDDKKNASEEHVNRSICLKLWIIRIIITIYGIITLPIYFLIQRPWRVWKAKRNIQAKHIREGDPFSPIKRVMSNYNVSLGDASTADEMFRMAVAKFGPKRCLGFRKVLAEERNLDKTGKSFRKLQLGDYQWFSYNDTEKSVDVLSKGLLALGLRQKQRIVIFAETRREWFLVLQACFRINVVVATIYSTLGEDGITSGINETEVSTIITSQELLLKLKAIIGKIPAVNKIIYMEDFTPAKIGEFPSNISLFKLSEIEQMGKNFSSGIIYQPPSSNDVALIMYTSGSTGRPKGVLISHKNIVATVIGMCHAAIYWEEDDVYIAFLPLAHIYEMTVELLNIHMGINIGYSSPFTLMEKSPGLMEGCKSDISVLKPTNICTVPLLLDRIKKGVNEAIAEKDAFTMEFFKYAIEYKSFWWKRGFNTPILNRIVFRKVQQILGGRVKDIVTASAHLSLDTHMFIRCCFDALLRQGYGATESTACGVSSKDFNTGRIGSPYFTCDVKLADWDEGDYKPTDKPYPRGEIVLGGDCITLGYFKNEDLTKECFKEEDGMRWFYTGDIGELFPDGTLKIIDRKKNLHKLPHGEYVSLSQVETELKTSFLVDNICVVGSIYRDYLVALVMPNEHQLKKLATMLNKEDLSLSELCKDRELVKFATTILRNHGKNNGLLSREIPQKIKLCTDEWTPETGLVTAALKIKRKALENMYKDSIDEMYDKSTSSS